MRAVLVVLLVGCGSGIAFEDFAAEQRDAYCGYYVRCGSFATIADCRTHLERQQLDNPSLAAAIDSGKVLYSESNAQDCIDALDDLDCDLTLQPAGALDVCDGVYRGTGTIGGTCAFDRECQSDRCVVPDCNDTCCQGTCQEPRVWPGLDEPCTTVCGEGLFCNYDQVCEAELQEGATCNAFTVCTYPLYCSDLGACTQLPSRGEFCDGHCALEGDVCGLDGVCVEALVGGDTCSTAVECSDYYLCNLDTRRCELPEVPVGSPNGTPCTFSTDCESRYCDAVCSDVPICF